MLGPYRVLSTPGFEKEARKLHRRNPRMYEALVEAVALLETDPFNLLRRADVRKLADVPAGEGQFRLRIGGYRLRYDVSEDAVILHSVRPRGASYR